MQISRERTEQAERRESVKALKQEKLSSIERPAGQYVWNLVNKGDYGTRQGWRELGRGQIT